MSPREAENLLGELSYRGTLSFCRTIKTKDRKLAAAMRTFCLRVGVAETEIRQYLEHKAHGRGKHCGCNRHSTL